VFVILNGESVLLVEKPRIATGDFQREARKSRPLLLAALLNEPSQSYEKGAKFSPPVAIGTVWVDGYAISVCLSKTHNLSHFAAVNRFEARRDSIQIFQWGDREFQRELIGFPSITPLSKAGVRYQIRD
jgi:hypothetical protein